MEKTNREKALLWWSILNHEIKTKFYNSFHKIRFTPANNYTELTGSEIEYIFDNILDDEEESLDNSLNDEKCEPTFHFRKHELIDLLHKCWIQATAKTLEPMQDLGFKSFIDEHLK